MTAVILFGPWTIQLFFLLLAILALNEFFSLVKSEQVTPAGFPAFAAATLIYIVVSRLFEIPFMPAAAIVIISCCFLFYCELFRKRKYPFHNIAYSAAGIIYTVIPFALLVKMSFITGEYNFRIPLGFFILLWSFDSFAYLFGRWLGRHRLLERISPKKSWEGFAGGLIMSFVASYILYKSFGTLSLYNWLMVAGIISVFGTAGDLVESMLKRSLDKKDSGTLLPGHGGLLDRFDAMLLSAPVVYAALLLSHWITRL